MHAADRSAHVCRGAFNVTGAFVTWRIHLMSKYGSQTALAGTASFDEYLNTPAGRAELHALRDCIHARAAAELNALQTRRERNGQETCDVLRTAPQGESRP